MNSWKYLLRNINDINSFIDPDTGELFFGDYSKLVEAFDIGVCFGLTHMWVQAVLCGKTDNFITKLKILCTNPNQGWILPDGKHFHNLAAVIYHTRSLVRQRIHNSWMKRYMEIPALLDGIVLYNYPGCSSHFTGLSAQNALEISRFTICKSLSSQGENSSKPLTMIYNQTWIGLSTYLEPVLKYILIYLTKLTENKPFAMTFISQKHIVGLSNVNNKFILFNQNYFLHNFFYKSLPGMEHRNIQYILTQAILSCFQKGNNLILNIRVYISSGNNAVFLAAQKKLMRNLNAFLTPRNKTPVHIQNEIRRINGDVSRINSFAEMDKYIITEFEKYHTNKKANPLPTRYVNSLLRKSHNQILIGFYNFIHRDLSMQDPLSETSYSNLYTKMTHQAATQTYENMIIRAARDGDFYMLNNLLKNDISKINNQDTLGNTPLMYAVESGYLPSTIILLEYNANVNIRSKAGDTALHFAATNGRANIAGLLIESGAIIDARNNGGYTPLHMAVGQGHKMVVMMLVKHKAMIDASDNDEGFTPLHIAVEKDNMDMIQLLTALGASINITDYSGNTPFELAREMDCCRIEELLSGRSTIPLSKDLYALDIRDYNHPPRHTCRTLI